MSTDISTASATDRKIAPLPRNLGLALIVIAAAQLMVVLDATIVNIALPSIQRALQFSPTDLEWVINAYALTFGGLLLLGGRAGDLFGRRRMFVVGIVVFTLGSLAGGFATSATWLIVARAAQGIGAAIVAPTALSLIADTFSEGPDRNRAFGVYGGVAGAGRGWAAPRRTAHQCCLMAMGPVRERANRHPARGRRPARARAIEGAGWPARPARSTHGHRRGGASGLQPRARPHHWLGRDHQAHRPR